MLHVVRAMFVIACATVGWVTGIDLYNQPWAGLFIGLGSGVVFMALQISAEGSHGIRGTFRAPNPNAAASFVERLDNRPEVETNEIGRFEHQGNEMIIEIHLVVND